MVVQPADRRLPTLPTNADREIPAPRGPSGYVVCSHHHFPESTPHSRLGRWQTRGDTRGENAPPAREDQLTNIVFVRSEVAGSRWISSRRDSPVLRLRQGWRDCCPPDAERSGSGAFAFSLSASFKRRQMKTPKKVSHLFAVKG